MKRVSIILYVLAIVLGLSLPAQATLVDMSDGTIYDTDTQLSWLQNANTAVIPLSWASANAWAAGLNAGSGFAGFTNWRLPTTTQPDATCSIQNGGDSYGYNCANSEMGHLFYSSLGNVQGALSNTGPFTNLQAAPYWSGTYYAPDPANAWHFYCNNGSQFAYNKGLVSFAWAVRPGARSTTTPVGYNPAWLIITLLSLTFSGGYILRRKAARQQ